MPEELTTPTIEDDIRAVENYAQNFHKMKTQGRIVGHMWLFSGCIFAGGCSLLHLPVAGLISVLIGAAIGGNETNRFKQRSNLKIPQDSLERILVSDDPLVIAFMFRAYEIDEMRWNRHIGKGLAAAIRRADSPDILVDGLAFWEKVRNHLSNQIEKGRYDSIEDKELLITIIEALVRWRMTKCLSKLLLLANLSTPTLELQRVREAAREAVDLLSVDADFGDTTDVPAMISELFPLIDAGGIWMSGQRERQLWLIYALTLQLPKLTKDDANWFDSRQRAQLRSLLSVHTPYAFGVSERAKSELKQAALLATGNMEDIKALQMVETLANIEAPTDHEQQTRTFARKQLAKLINVKEKQAVGSMLLRASDAPNIPQDQLLRPAHPTIENAETELLLRPHDGK